MTTMQQADAALMTDGTRVLLDAIERLLVRKRDIFRNNLRRGEMYNNGSRGINCAGSYPATTWEHGAKIMEYLRNVSNIYDIMHVAIHSKQKTASSQNFRQALLRLRRRTLRLV